MLYSVGDKGDGVGGRLIEVGIVNILVGGGSEGYKKRKRVVIVKV